MTTELTEEELDDKLRAFGIDPGNLVSSTINKLFETIKQLRADNQALTDWVKFQTVEMAKQKQVIDRVWLVFKITRVQYGEEGLVGVYSTKEKAVEICASLPGEQTRIEEVKVL